MSELNTINNIVKAKLCTGCGTCVSICPNCSISMRIYDREGIYVPEIDKRRCSECGMCLKVCPGSGINIEEYNIKLFKHSIADNYIGRFINCYTGYSCDQRIRLNSSSGGLVTQILVHALEDNIIDGALVTKMHKDRPLEPESFIARTKEEIIDSSGSKYCPVPANIALREIINSKRGERFAIVGLPCHIHGARKAASLNRALNDKIVLYLGIFCAKGVTFLGNKFLFTTLGIKGEDIWKIDYRKKGWPGGINIWLNNGSNINMPYLKYYSNYAFFEPWRCTLCADATCELADIALGDAWIPEIMGSDRIGTSIIITRAKYGEALIQNMHNKRLINLQLIDNSKVRQSQGEVKWKKRDINSRINISKLLMKKTPLYDQNYLPLSAPLFNYLITSAYYPLRLIALNPKLWKLLRVYHDIINKR